jgi:lipopolysaccharide transport system permease protein
MSALTAKYRDLSHISSFILQIGLYATTVIYPLSEVMRFLPEGLRWVLGLNPMITVVELYRLMFLGESALTWQIATVSALVTFTLLWTGILIFNEVQRRFADFA